MFQRSFRHQRRVRCCYQLQITTQKYQNGTPKRVNNFSFPFLQIGLEYLRFFQIQNYKLKKRRKRKCHYFFHPVLYRVLLIRVFCYTALLTQCVNHSKEHFEEVQMGFKVRYLGDQDTQSVFHLGIPFEIDVHTIQSSFSTSADLVRMYMWLP